MMKNACDPARTELFLYSVNGKYQHLFEAAWRHIAFQEAETFREQVGAICDLLYGSYDGITYEQVGYFFNVSKSTICTQYKRYNSSRKANGRPSVLTPEEVEEVGSFITMKYSQQDPASYDDVSQFVFYNLHKPVLPDTLRNIIRNLDGFKVVEGVPIELDRMLCDPEAIDLYFERMAEIIDGVPGSFLLNIDESGYQPYADAIKHRCIIPSGSEEERVFFGVDRGAKKCTLLAGIFGDGTTLKPFILIERKTIENEMLLEGYSTKKYCFCYREKAFMSMQTFNLWAELILFPEIEKRRNKFNYSGPCIIIMDGCTSHASTDFEEKCHTRNIIVVFLAPHSSDQCQMLDLVIFGVQKRFMKKIRGDKYLSKQSKQLIRVLSSWRAATTPENIIAAFKSAGYEPYIENDSLFYRINIEFARAVRHYHHADDPIPKELKKRINIGKGK